MNIVTELMHKLVNCSSLFEVEELILSTVMKWAQEIMKNFLESYDQVLMDQVPDSYRVINRQERTITFAFGSVTFNRRYYKTDDQQMMFYLDQELAIEARRRLSPYYRKMMALVAQTTTMRNTATVLNLLFNSGVTVDSVMHAVHEIGAPIKEATKHNEQAVVPRYVPTNLTIEGDAFVIKLKSQELNQARWAEVHHFRVYERIKGKIVNRHDFIELGNLNRARARVSDYLDRHYKLNDQTIFLASDGGPGYDPQAMKALVPVNAQGEYFIDRYHCLRKVEMTLGHDNKLTPLAIKAIRQYDKTALTAVLDTHESFELSPKQLDDLERLRSYLHRNWDYLSSPKQRDYHGIGMIGSIESAHRAFTYRMKKQGKTWTENGAQAMLNLIEARVNGHLEISLEQILKQEMKIPAVGKPALLQEMKIQMRPFLRKIPSKPSRGSINGRIFIDAPTSSPFGKLVKSFTH